MSVLDCHHHIGNVVLSVGVNRAVDYPRPWSESLDADYDARVSMMKSAGPERAVLMPVNRYLRENGIEDTRRLNDAIAQYRDRDRDRFVAALGVVEPLHGPGSLEEIRRIRDELGMVGVSYHARWQGVATNDPWMLEQISLLGELGMIPFVHAHAESRLESPSMVGHLAKEFPEVPIIVCDALSTPSHLIHFLDIAELYSNVYLETSLLYSPDALSKLVSELGSERVIFGSDSYSFKMVTRITPEVIGAVGLGEREVENILHSNMECLLEAAGGHQE